MTSLARSLDIDFDICQGKLENFRGQTMGSLIINIEDKNLEQVVHYLNNHKIEWEVIDRV